MKMLRPLAIALCSLVVALSASSSAFAAATIVIVNADPAGQGFNDTTVVAPVGGNPGTTLGQQRLNAFQAAANKWGATLDSVVTIRIQAQWTALTCTATSAVLGSAGAIQIFRNFAGAPFTSTWYNESLTGKIFGADPDPATAEITANFNINLGQPGCLTGTFFYLGLDNNHGTDVDLVTVLEHEFAHGLGFQSFTNGSTGAYQSGFPSVFDRFLMDLSSGKSWLQMTNAERAASALNTHKLAWDGPQVTTDVASVLTPGLPVLKVNSPGGLAGNYDVGSAAYGPALTAVGVTGNLKLANDGTAPITDGCEAFPAGFFTGQIAVIDRGTCTFKTKSLNAQNANAIGVVIVNNAAGTAPALGDDAAIVTPITIPTISLSQSDGAAIVSQLGTGVNATIQVDNNVRFGADPFGKALMFAPNPFNGGSSVSHWDTIASPNQLMEPNISADLTHEVTTPQDLTFSQLRDIGWVASSIPSSIAKTTGDNQITVINQPFLIPISVTVSPAISGIEVSWTVNFSPPITGAGATFPSNNSRFAVTTTNALGVAIAPALTANGQSGVYSMNATAPGAGTTTFNLSNDPVPVAGNACLSDTTQADFQAGVATNTDLTTIPGSVTLVKPANVDQQQLEASLSGTGFNTVQWLGQTFVPSVTGQLKKIDLSLFCAICSGTDQPITVEIRTTTGSPALPTATVLASTTLAGFSSGVSSTFTPTFASPATLTAGTTYAFTLRLVTNRTGTYAAVFSNGPAAYANGNRVVSTNSGGTWTVATSSGTARDLVFTTYMQTDFAASGDFVSSLKDSNPVVPGTTLWSTLSWNATVPAPTTLQFQVGASNSFGGPFNFVGPDGTTGTYFSNGASLAQFNGFRYLKYKAFFTTSDGTQTPTLNDVTVCYTNPTPPNVSGTKSKAGGNTTGSSGSYTVILSNTGGVVQADNSGDEFTDTLPSSLSLVSASATSGTAATAANTVTWNGSILPAGSVTITINFTINSVPDGTVASNQGTINYDGDGNLTNESNRLTDDPLVVGTSDPTVFTISDVNDPPDAVNDALSSVAEDSGQRIIPIATLLANDSAGPSNESGQTLTLTEVGNPVGGTVTKDATNVYFTPAADFNGAASFEYAITDNGTTGGSPDPKTDTATVSFTVTEVNDAPSAVNDTIANTAEDAQYSIPFATLTGNDSKGPANESGQTLTLTGVGSPVGGTVTNDATNVYFTPTADFNGAASFQYTVTDNGTTNGSADFQTDTATVSFTITEVNNAPSAVNDTLANIAEDSGPRAIPFASLTGNDSKGPANESGQTLTIISANNAVGGTILLVPGFVVFTPTENYNGPASFDYIVEDNGTTNGVADPKTSGTAAVQFNITEVNDFPTAVADTLANVAEDSGERTITFAELTGNDSKGAANESGQTLIVKTVSNPVGVTVNIVGGTVRITPLPDFTGAASFQYTVEDNGTTNGFLEQRASGPALVQFTVSEVNDAPAAVNDTLTNVAEDSGQRTIPFADLTGNDSKGPANESGQSLIVKTVSNPVGGTVSIVGGNVLFTPAAEYNGPASFDYTVEDNGTTNGAADPLTSGTATASFNIGAVADSPSVTNATTNANTQTTSGLVISRNPADGPEVTHFKITGITGGSLFKNDGLTPINNGDFITVAEGNAGLKFTPGTTNGSFTVQASTSAADAGLGGGTATATITVNPLGGVIRFTSGTYNVDEGAGFSIITVERTGDTSQAVTVDYASSDLSNPADFIPCNSPGAGFASSRCDFTTAIGTLHFAAGETSKTFNVLIGQDNYLEGPETLDLTLSNPTGGAVLGVPATGNLGITDDTTEGLTNPIDVSSDFVRALYHDILNREPDGPGLAFWTDNIEKCTDPARRPAGLTVEQCVDKQRESTAVAFFMSPEVQINGGFVYRLYKGSLTGAPNYDGGSPGRFPTFVEFIKDVSQVSAGTVVNNQISGAVVEANRNQLAAEFVQRPEFIAKYSGLNNTLYVDELFNTTTIIPTPAEKQALVDGLTNGTETRASVLRKVVDGTVVISEGNVQFTTTYGQAFYNQESRRLFVFMEYAGFLRRNPDTAGFVFWLGKLNQFNGDPFQAEMVRSFILSPEYRNRFGQ